MHNENKKIKNICKTGHIEEGETGLHIVHFKIFNIYFYLCAPNIRVRWIGLFLSLTSWGEWQNRLDKSK